MAQLLPPNAGVVDQVERVNTPPNAAPPQAMRNVRPVIGKDGVRRMGRRDGLEVVAQFGAPIQEIGVVPVPSAATFQPTGSRLLTQLEPIIDPTGGSGYSGSLFFMRPSATGTGIDFAAQLDDPDATYSAWNGSRVAWSDNETGSQRTSGAWTTIGEKSYGGSIGLRRCARLMYWTSPTGAIADGESPRPTVMWSALMEDRLPNALSGSNPDPYPIIPRKIVVYEPFVFVCAGPWVYVYATNDIPSRGITAGQYIERIDMRGWAWAIEDMEVTYRATRAGTTAAGNTSGFGNQPCLLIAYTGTPGILGPVTSDTYKEGSFFRSGIAEYVINPAITLPSGTVSTLVFQRSRFGADETTDTFGEGSLDFRTRNLTPSGRGRRVLDMCVPKGTNSDPEVGRVGTKNSNVWPVANPAYCATTNDGYGRNASAGNIPNGDGGYFNAFQIRASDLSTNPLANAVYWRREIDGNSIKRLHESGLGTYNDIWYNNASTIPNSGNGPEASLNACTFDDNRGNVIFAGTPSNGFNIYNCDGDNGTVFNRNNLGALVPQHGLAFDRRSDRVVAVTPRNNAWAGAAGAYAIVFWLNPDSLVITNTFDLGASGLDARGVAVNEAGWAAVVTEKL